MAIEENTSEENVFPCNSPEKIQDDDSYVEINSEEFFKMKDLLQRVQADSVNYRKRVEEEKNYIREQSNIDLILRILPILDDFDRAIKHKPNSKDVGSWIEGISLLHKNLTSTLESIGVYRIDALEKPFNPLEHESILYETTELFEKDSVISIVREGYKLNGKVIRPTQVVVSKNCNQNMESTDKPKYDSTDKES